MFAAFALSLALAGDSAPPPSLDAPSLAVVARDVVETWRIAPGVAIAWVSPEGSGVVCHGASGGPMHPDVDADTAFQIGSITKTVTGLLLAEMVDRGEVRLDEPLGALLPEVTGPAAAIKLQDLATHTSGLPRMPLGPGLLAAVLLHRGNPYRGIGPEHVIAAVSGTARLGEGFEYSNLGMSVLGLALARRAATDYPTLATERELRPLQMDAQFSGGAHAARGHGVNLGPTPSWTFDGYAPAGGLYASGEAMRRFLVANLAGTAPGATLAHTPLATIEAGERVGLAWMISERRGHTITWHNGGTGGFRSWLGFDRERGIGVVVLANADNSVDRVGGWLLDVAHAPAPPEPSPAGLGALGALCAWSLGLIAILGRGELAKLSGWRRTLVGGNREPALVRCATVLIFLGFLADFADWRGAPPGTFAFGGAVALGANAWLLWRSWGVPAPQLVGARAWAGRVWVVAITTLMLWAAFGSPRVG